MRYSTGTILKNSLQSLWNDILFIENLLQDPQKHLKTQCHIRHFSRKLLDILQNHIFPQDSNKSVKLSIIHDMLFQSKEIEQGHLYNFQDLKKQLSLLEELVLTTNALAC